MTKGKGRGKIESISIADSVELSPEEVKLGTAEQVEPAEASTEEAAEPLDMLREQLKDVDRETLLKHILGLTFALQTSEQAMEQVLEPTLWGIWDSTSLDWFCDGNGIVFSTHNERMARAQLQHVQIRGHSADRWELKELP